jgi:hypothetical protein
VTERLAIDTNAAIDLMRSNRPDPPPLDHSRPIVVPLESVEAKMRTHTAGRKYGGDIWANPRRGFDPIVGLTVIHW